MKALVPLPASRAAPPVFSGALRDANLMGVARPEASCGVASYVRCSPEAIRKILNEQLTREKGLS
ncbi:hypothetical protein AA0228_2250 [Gluconobacter frateurii NRIC 0228]|uniref:Uncharacterized protein n=1 Tax=Gluconobacter frateurii NRIC 0228 TaxID=1307946 RepID=A0ABQ0QDG1_9PROT|nr:hypothetical protein AA0228_2250 [Gluconobacter frateurii NRIC 0228]